MKKIILLVLTLGLALSLTLGAQAAGYKTAGDANFSFNWKIVGNELEVMMSASSTGWIAVGFEPSMRMKDANFILAYVANGVVSISDEFGTSPIAHRPDTALGGTSNVTAVGGTEAGGKTTVTFRIPLNSGDKYDAVLTAGKSHKVIWAFGPNGQDDFVSKHSRVGMFTVTL